MDVMVQRQESIWIKKELLIKRFNIIDEWLTETTGHGLFLVQENIVKIIIDAYNPDIKNLELIGDITIEEDPNFHEASRMTANIKKGYWPVFEIWWETLKETFKEVSFEAISAQNELLDDYKKLFTEIIKTQAEVSNPEDLKNNLVDKEGLNLMQISVLSLASQGKTNKEIARKLDCSKDTIGTYWRQIFKYFDVDKRGAALVEAVLRKFI